MSKKKGNASKPEAIPVLETERLLVFQVTRPVTDREFEMIKNRLESQEDEGLKIVLVPYLVTLKEDT